MNKKQEIHIDKKMVWDALKDSISKLNPALLYRNPIIFVIEIVALITTVFLFIKDNNAETSVLLQIQIVGWLWVTVFFANFAEAIAERRGKAQADSLRQNKEQMSANRIFNDGSVEVISAGLLHRGDIVMISAGETIPGDGEVIEGIASVDESTITGESAPVIRESGGDRSGVIGGTRVLSDWIKVRISSEPGESFLEKMISLVEGAKRQKTPNEIALTILLTALTLIFLLVVVTLEPYAIYANSFIPPVILASLFVCLAPTTIGSLLSAIGIAGMERLLRRNVIAMSGKAAEAAGDVDILLLDKTGTITYGNRMATDFFPAPGISEQEIAIAAGLASMSDDTPEGKSIVSLVHEKYGEFFVGDINEFKVIKFSANTRISGIDYKEQMIRKGASDAIEKFIAGYGNNLSVEVKKQVAKIAEKGGTPLLVAEDGRILGVIYLKDVVKQGIRERFERLRKMGIKTVMITGDNPLTAASIAAEAGVDGFLAEATPENKIQMIRDYQEKGHMVAMTGDGTNDAPALAQADVGVVMNSGTQAAKEAGNMVDMDNSPTKLVDIVEIGKQLLMTRGALTTFSIANDISKYFAIVPAMFVVSYPELNILNVMHLASPESAILSAVIFNALIIIALIPLALKGIPYRPLGAVAILRRNMFIYGVGGIIIPFFFIKVIDIFINFVGLV